MSLETRITALAARIRDQFNALPSRFAALNHGHGLADAAITGIIPDAKLPGRLGLMGYDAGTNFNDALYAGWWYIANPNAANAPRTNTYWIGQTLYYPTAGYVAQVAYGIAGDGANQKFWRTCVANTWLSWKEDFDTGHLPTWTEVAGKPTTFPPESHSHAWNDITLKPATYPPAGHSHTYTDLPMSGAPTQAQAEAGTETAERSWSSLRVRQAIASYAYSKAQTDAAIATGIANAQDTLSGNEINFVERTTNLTVTNQTFRSATVGLISGLSFTVNVATAGIVELLVEMMCSCNLASSTMGLWFVINSSVAAPGGRMTGVQMPVAGRTTLARNMTRFTAAANTNYLVQVGAAITVASGTPTLTLIGASPDTMQLSAVRRS